MLGAFFNRKRGLKNRADAQQFLTKAIDLEEIGETLQAIDFYNKAISVDPEWATPYYNLGLIYKYSLDWSMSFQCNQQAVKLDPDNEAAWWNLGIAATALGKWKIAKQAWKTFRLDVEINDNEPNMNLGSVPIRLNPNDSGEVVWCDRIDPARAKIYNIPLPSSGFRFGDLVLNDGAPVGYRMSGDKEVPVFNELQLLQKSIYKTFSAVVMTDDEDHINKLEEMCKNANVEMEDWSTMIWLCKQCSEGTVHEIHDHDLEKPNSNERNIGFSCIDKGDVENVLNTWKVITLCEYSEVKTELE